jgi:MraZ protein
VVNLYGTYECKADSKGRLMLPSALKKQLDPVTKDGFVLKRSVYHPCIELYPVSEWEIIMKKIHGLNRFTKNTNDFIRRYTAGFKMIDIDNVGRLLIPKDLKSFSGIKKNIVVAATINLIEIWSKDKYDQAINDSSLNFEELARQVMGEDEDEKRDE